MVPQRIWLNYIREPPCGIQPLDPTSKPSVRTPLSGNMTAGPVLASPSLQLPELRPKGTSPSTPPTAATQQEEPTSSSALARKCKSSVVVVDGIISEEVRPAVKLARRATLPAPAPVPVLRRRRRSGDFSLPVRYKYVVIPGNNSRAVLAAFRRRPWWGPARKEEDGSAAVVVRSSFVSRRKKGKSAAGGGPGSRIGYSNNTFNLWWEMYASKPVIEGTNLDAKLRQAVNHFEFNDALVSKKGLWQSLRAYCTSGGLPVTSVVPQTFYLSGGARQSSSPSASSRSTSDSSAEDPSCGSDERRESSSKASRDDDRTEFLACCAAMDAVSGVSSSTTAAGVVVPPGTAVVSPCARVGTSQLTAVRSPTLPRSTPATVGVAAGEVEKATAIRSSTFPSANPATSTGEAVPEGGVLAADGNCSPQGGAAAPCPPPDPGSRSMPPHSPSRPLNSTSARIVSPRSSTSLETSSWSDAGVGQGKNDLPVQNGSAMPDIDTNPGVTVPDVEVFDTVAAELDDDAKGRHSVSLEKKGAAEGGTTAVGSSEGETTRKGIRKSGSIHSKEDEKGSTNGNESGCTVTSVAKSGSPIGATRPEGEARNVCTTGGVEPGGAAGGMPTWVVKPAANSNCGFGIQVCCSLKEVLDVVDATDNRAGRSGWVVQSYIARPLLVRGRKFDIRLFVLLVADPSTRSWRRRSKSSWQKPSNSNSNSSSNGCAEHHGGQTGKAGGVEGAADLPSIGADRGGSAAGSGAKSGAEVTPASGSDDGDGGGTIPPSSPCPLRAWCHKHAYVRMSSVRYSNDPSKVKDKFVHLTNNAVQRRSPSYGQDEPGNKLTLSDLQDWLDGDGSKHKGTACGWVEQTLRPRMHALVATSVAAAASAGINKRGRPYAFELLGYDFMVDDDLRVWLIEVNSNPCLEFVCPLLQKMIVGVIDDTLSIALDSVFRPPEKHRTAAASVGAGGLGGDGVGGDSEGLGCGFTRVYPVVD